jgi:hypothetical protein
MTCGDVFCDMICDCSARAIADVSAVRSDTARSCVKAAMYLSLTFD